MTFNPSKRYDHNKKNVFPTYFLTAFTHKNLLAFMFHERYHISCFDVKYNQFNGARLMSLAETWSCTLQHSIVPEDKKEIFKQ